MMTYEEYQTSIVINIEAMKETRRKQNEEQQLLDLEVNSRMADARRRYMEEQEAIRSIQRDKAKAISDKWKAERVRLHLEHAKIIEQWREEHGISTPPIYRTALRRAA